jgi:hypothetical protein
MPRIRLGLWGPLCTNRVGPMAALAGLYRRHWRVCTKCTIERFETQHAFAQHNLNNTMFYRLPRIAYSQQTTDLPWNNGCCQYLTSILFVLLDPAAKNAWWWVSYPWWMMSTWKSRGPCSQSPGHFSLATMLLSPKLEEIVNVLVSPMKRWP